jgi:hydrogenase nickel incorporation protein HypA/HybF
MASVLSSVEEAAHEAKATRVTCIRLVVGDLTEVVDDALGFALEALGPGTVSEGAELVVERVAPRSRCTQCGHEFTHDRFHRTCPLCDALATELLAGRELYIKNIEIAHAPSFRSRQSKADRGVLGDTHLDDTHLGDAHDGARNTKAR